MDGKCVESRLADSSEVENGSENMNKTQDAMKRVMKSLLDMKIDDENQ